jgi:hypothetical protein
MENRMIRGPTRLAPGGRFDWRPPPPVPFRATEELDVERLKRQLLTDWLNRVETAEELALIRRAANEAAAVAWLSPYPLLVLPLLLEEKAHKAAAQAKRQRQIRERSRLLLTQVA